MITQKCKQTLCTQENKTKFQSNKKNDLKATKLGELTTSKALRRWRGVIPSTNSQYASPHTKLRKITRLKTITRKKSLKPTKVKTKTKLEKKYFLISTIRVLPVVTVTAATFEFF